MDRRAFAVLSVLRDLPDEIRRIIYYQTMDLGIVRLQGLIRQFLQKCRNGQKIIHCQDCGRYFYGYKTDRIESCIFVGQYCNQVCPNGHVNIFNHYSGEIFNLSRTKRENVTNIDSPTLRTRFSEESSKRLKNIITCSKCGIVYIPKINHHLRHLRSMEYEEETSRLPMAINRIGRVNALIPGKWPCVALFINE